MNRPVLYTLHTLSFISIFFLIRNIHSMHFNPETYAQNNEPQRDWIQYAQIPLSESQLTVLDVGCGDGKCTVDLLKTLPYSTIIAIDPNQQMIDFSKITYKDQKNVRWEMASVESITYSKCFDMTVSFSTLQWVQNINKALKNIYKALKKDGYLYAILSAKNNADTSSFSNTYSRAVSEQFLNPKYSALLNICSSKLNDVLRKYNPAEFEILLKNAGFSNISCTARETPYTFTSKEKFIDWILAASPFGSVLGDLHLSFCQDVANTYINTTKQKNQNQVIYNHYLLYAEAQK